jgi:hypothetical protein
MAYYLPAESAQENEPVTDIPAPTVPQAQRMADLKIFWGPDMCRLEYLIHLLDTGRIKEEYAPCQS